MKRLRKEIIELKRKKNAVILAHNYQPDEVQEVADFLGDSLELARAAAKTEAKIIVFCGVDFMAETAKILNPEKMVLVPEPNACCPMVSFLNEEKVREAKREYPGAPVVLYVNSSAKTKALADYLCTSANAVRVVKALKEKQVLFGPDRNLAEYVQEQVPDKKVIPLPPEGYCPTHEMIKKEEIAGLKKAHPNAVVIAHPECLREVRQLADFVGSTAQMYGEAKRDKAKEFIVATERGLASRMQREIPGKTFYACRATCPNMKKTTLEKARDSLVEGKTEVEVAGGVQEKVRLLLEKMIKK